MRALLSAMPALLRQSVAIMLQYRGELVLWALWGVIYPVVAMTMWSAAVKGSGGTDIHGLGPRDFAAYFLLTMIVGHATAAWDVYDMGYLVRTGGMSVKLLQPLLPVWERVADNLAYKLVTLALLLPIWAVAAWVARPAFETSRVDLMLGIPSLLLGAAVCFIWCYTLGVLAFWVTRMDAVGEMWFGASLFFGGRLAPLNIMPMPLQVIASCLPFKWMIWFPSMALMGRLDTAALVTGLVCQLGWLAGGLLALRLVWFMGVRRYSAVGS
jgi:ABC-2 type transport system permease protein